MDSTGKIITFHAYKGGSGTSMTLSNTAWLLASAGKRVLALDWDLESPSLHRYLRPFLTDPELKSTEGLMEAALAFTEGSIESLDTAVSVDWDFPNGGSLELLPAGRQGPAYPVHVMGFDWRAFARTDAGTRFYQWLKRELPKQYDFVLVDTSSGLRDTTALSSFMLPEALCLCLTLNRVNIAGCQQLASMSRQAGAEAPPRIFPILSRVDPAEKLLLDEQRDWARKALEPFLEHLGDSRQRQLYFREIEFPYVPYHSYGEVLPVFMDRPGDGHSISSVTERLCHFLTGETLDFKYPDPSTREDVLARWGGR